jgi:GDPmannose 4,6-dehydratase
VVGMQDNSTKIALITGVSGQDGFYLAELLLANGYHVYGTSRSKNFELNISKDNKIKVFQTDYSKISLINILDKLKPSLLFNLAGQSYVSKSWDLLSETVISQGVLVANIIDAIQIACPKVKLLNMTSAEIFDHSIEEKFNENTPKKPYNPYGCAQLLGHSLIEVYRKIKGLWASNSILFPHESKRRPNNFLFPRILKEAKKISNNKKKTLSIGNLKVSRDWSYAPIVMEGVFLQSKLEEPTDICFCSGESFTVEQILQRAFSNFELDYRNHIKIDEALVRNYEPLKSVGNNQKAKSILNWEPKYNALNIIDIILKKI